MPKTTIQHELTVHALTSKLWSILTSSECTRQFLFHDELVSEWTEGSPVLSASTNRAQGAIQLVVPGVLMRFHLQLPEISNDPVYFQYELVPGEDGIQLLFQQEFNLHPDVSLQTVSENTRLMLQKIKWLAEYS